MNDFVKIDSPPPGQLMTLARSFLAQVLKTPDHVALESVDESLTYRELYERAMRLALRLQALGVGPNALVAVCADRSVEYIVAILAIVQSGGAYLPIDPKLPQQRIDFIVADGRPRAILVEAATKHHFDDSACAVLLLDNPETSSLSGQVLDSGTKPEDLAYVMYTSGSTGVPKGVAIPQSAVVHLVRGVTYATLDEHVRLLLHSPLTFDASTFEIWGSLLNGGTCVLMPEKRLSLLALEEFLVSQAITTTFMTPALVRELADKRPFAFRQVRELLTGGEVVPPKMVRKILADNPATTVIVVYGPTECTTFTTTHRYHHAAEVPDPIPLGEPIPATSVHVLDDNLDEVGIGEVGEIFVGGSRLAVGYFNRPDLTEAAFLRDKFCHDAKARLYRTGDLGLRAPSGDLLFKGRRDRQIKLRGFRIELEEIEAQLQQHPAVHAAAVSAVEYAGGAEKTLVAHVVPLRAALYADIDLEQPMLSELIEQWQQVYSTLLYKSLATPVSGSDATFNTAGWTSSFDGRHILDEEMAEQVDQAVDRILALSPRNVLEIGCGTGMLMFRLAPKCERYVGTDFSKQALDYVQSCLDSMGTLPQVSLHHADAHDLPPSPGDGFDVVVLNSVTEHFPSLAYLDDLLRKLCTILKPGGHVFLGDNRSFPLLKLFHASVELFKSNGTVPIPAFSMLVEQALANEHQLTIDPYYFAQLDPVKYRCVSLQCKRGTHHNELTGYRFDALLRYGLFESPPKRSEERHWNAANDSATTVRIQLETGELDGAVLQEIPNLRLPGAMLLLDAVAGNTAYETVGQLRRAIENDRNGEDPERYWRLGEELGYDVQVVPTHDSATGHFDLVLHRQRESHFDASFIATAPKPLTVLANDPLFSARAQKLTGTLRDYLARHLPNYAVPAFFVTLPRFALSPTGKIDYAALPLPARLRQPDATAPFMRATPEQDTLDEQLRSAWETVLHIGNIEPDENFFAIGGDSLKAVKLAAELSERLGTPISPALVFEAPTLAKLTVRLSESATVASRNAEGNSRGSRRRAAMIGRGGRSLREAD